VLNRSVSAMRTEPGGMHTAALDRMPARPDSQTTIR
jgi:hypothetical protein